MKKKRKKQNLSSRLTDHGIQAFLIFASVLLAFWLSDHRDKNKEQETLEISLKHIASEIMHNHYRIENVLMYYTDLLRQMDSLYDVPGTKWDTLYGYHLENWNGLRTPRLRSTAYTTFLNQGVNNTVDFDIAQSLAGIYSLQLMVENLDKSIFEKAATDNAFTALSKIRHQFNIYTEILPQLLMVYQNKGKPILSNYGYNLEIHNQKITEMILKYSVEK